MKFFFDQEQPDVSEFSCDQIKQNDILLNPTPENRLQHSRIER